MLNEAGEELDLGLAIQEVLEDGDTVIVKHSMQRKTARSKRMLSAPDCCVCARAPGS